MPPPSTSPDLFRPLWPPLLGALARPRADARTARRGGGVGRSVPAGPSTGVQRRPFSAGHRPSHAALEPRRRVSVPRLQLGALAEASSTRITPEQPAMRASPSVDRRHCSGELPSGVSEASRCRTFADHSRLRGDHRVTATRNRCADVRSAHDLVATWHMSEHRRATDLHPAETCDKRKSVPDSASDSLLGPGASAGTILLREARSGR